MISNKVINSGPSIETICFRNGYNPPSRQPFITLVLRNIAIGWKRGHLAAKLVSLGRSICPG